MKYIGKYGEHLVLLHLLKMEIEAYLAIKVNQDDYDLTIITDDQHVIRVQVKSTDLHSTGTNNAQKGTEKQYDFLVIVIVDDGKDRIFILTKDEATEERGTTTLLGVSQQRDKKFEVKNNLLKYEYLWDKCATRITIQMHMERFRYATAPSDLGRCPRLASLAWTTRGSTATMNVGEPLVMHQGMLISKVCIFWHIMNTDSGVS
jgi:hypothetical protein